MESSGYERWERATRKWWFFVLLVLIQFIIPPFSTKGFIDWGMTAFILQNSLMTGWTVIYPLFQAATVVSVLALLLLRNRFGRIFSIYAALSYLLFAVGQSISVTGEYGFALLTLNFIMFVFVAAFWLWEAFLGRNDFSARPRSPWKYWVVVPAFLAFWFPLNWETLGPDFNPAYLVTSGSALTFCMMTPLFLAVLTVFHPRVNLVTMRVTALIGLIIGFYNMIVNFVFEPALWWNGVLHIPLVLLSIYGLVLAYLKATA